MWPARWGDPAGSVGWSYGGFIICDYLRAHGQERIGAVELVAGAVTLGSAAFGTLIGRELAALTRRRVSSPSLA